FFRRWVNRTRRPKSALAPVRKKIKLGLEAFEDRVVPANPATTVPAVSVDETRALMTGFQAGLAVDPTNPNKMVTVAAAQSRNPITGLLTGVINGRFSVDGGLNWVSFDAGNTAGWGFNGTGISNGGPQDFRDPLTGNPNNSFLFSDSSSPSVTFARNGD